MFTNLLDNAIKYSKDGRPEIAITARSEAGDEIITFEDNGRGIPEADLERIFEPEFRSANARGEQGSGVGLSLCRSIMKGHHGSIRALPGVPRGAVFELRFPRIDASHG
jgi:signal transduction histidine kinase